ncbi:hypothetical protein [Aliiroseovarius sp.]|uniref:hypothetical protein n=1 Tax=Aliiroseovarius sp. TaxID=1872442 RepID=UPI003BA9E43E
MPIEFACYANPTLLHLRLSGRVTLEDMLDAQKAYASSPDFAPGIDELIEFLPGADLDMTYAEMRRLRRAEEAYYKQAAQPPRCAILAPDSTQFGMGRMYATLTDLRGDVRTEVVTTWQEALAFLELTDIALTVA